MTEIMSESGHWDLTFEDGLSLLLSSATSPSTPEDEDYILVSHSKCSDSSPDSSQDILSTDVNLQNEDFSMLDMESSHSYDYSVDVTPSYPFDCFPESENLMISNWTAPLAQPVQHKDLKDHRGNLLRERVRDRVPTSQKIPLYTENRRRECTVTCWLFRLLLSSEFNSLPLASIFDSFQENHADSASVRHWRQSIRHSLNASNSFVRVLTPDPRKNHLIINDSGSWWSVHPQCIVECVKEAFSNSPEVHRCPRHSSRAISSRLMNTRIQRRPLRFLSSRRWFGVIERDSPKPPPQCPSHRCRFALSPTAANEDFVIDHEEIV